uniref:uncharacterized protein LOC129120380 n=1 Tax=Agelaius phoeniceus TaxID=39638 RepID=UPI0023EB24CB|nr:uncharacterized protein LOC129120380 [Agelaius phoeniceus]
MFRWVRLISRCSPQLSSELGSIRQIAARVGRSGRLGCCRVRSAVVGHTRLLSAPLGHTRLHSALPHSAPRCNGGRWQGPAPRPEPREGTERWDSRLSPAHPVPARPRVPRSAPCSAERSLWARSGDNALGSAAAPGGSGRCPQGRKNHPTPPMFARSFGVGAAKGKRLQQQGSALEGSGPAHAVGEPGLAQGMVQVLLWHQSCCPLEPCSRLSLLEQPGPCRAQALRHRESPVPWGLWHLVRNVAAAPGAGWRSKPPSRARLQWRPELCLEQGVLRAASACAAPA